MLLKVEPVPLQLNVANGLYLKIASNLADLNNAVVARASLGLGSLATVNDAPVDGSTYGRNNGAWAVAAGGGVSLPVVDETALVFKTGTPANTLTFDVTAYTAAHVITWPDAAMTVAGLEVANVFTAAQTIDIAADALPLRVQGHSTQTNNIFEFRKDTRTTPSAYITPEGTFISRLVPDAGSSTQTGLTIRAHINGATLTQDIMDLSFVNSSSGQALLKNTFRSTSGIFRLQLTDLSTTRNFDFGFSDLKWGISGLWLLGTGSGTGREFVSALNSSIPVVKFGWNNSPNAGYINIISAETTVFQFQIDGVSTANMSNVGLWQFIPNTATNNAIMNTVTIGANVTGAGVGAAGFGPGILFTSESSTTINTSMARLAALWQTATHASRVADLVAYASDSAGEVEIWRGRAGAAPLVGFLGATPVVRQAHIADPAGGGTVDTEARTAINAILVVLENFGFVATS